MRDRFCVGHVRLGAYSLKTQEIQSADESLDVGTKRKGITVKHPLDPDQGHEDITHR